MPEVHVWRDLAAAEVATEEHSQATTVYPQGLKDLSGLLVIEWSLRRRAGFG